MSTAISHQETQVFQGGDHPCQLRIPGQLGKTVVTPPRMVHKTLVNNGTFSTWQFFVTFLGRLSDPFKGQEGIKRSL